MKCNSCNNDAREDSIQCQECFEKAKDSLDAYAQKSKNAVYSDIGVFIPKGLKEFYVSQKELEPDFQEAFNSLLLKGKQTTKRNR